MCQLNEDQVVRTALALIINRFKTEQPDRVLSKPESENIQFVILGKLNRGETEQEVMGWCKTVPLKKKCIHKNLRNGY